MPPATTFWSITLYETGTYDLYPNEEEIYVVGSNHASTVFGDDVSVEIVFAHTRPSDLGEANWIPVPEGPFWLGARFYAPAPEVFSGEYELPGIVRLD